jgi:hypothetical protein
MDFVAKQVIKSKVSGVKDSLGFGDDDKEEKKSGPSDEDLRKEKEKEAAQKAKREEQRAKKHAERESERDKIRAKYGLKTKGGGGKPQSRQESGEDEDKSCSVM